MSTLRQRLKRPEIYLAPVVLLYALAAADSFRQPSKQTTSRVYLAAVHGYQLYGRPWLQPYIRCRYRPTCSEYSAQAVRKWGIRHGLALTAKRLLSCKSAVPLGTPDPVP
ncbi:MAG: membrane protein insertion efficiency factor YidD [Bryobacteraceae bacterium]